MRSLKSGVLSQGVGDRGSEAGSAGRSGFLSEPGGRRGRGPRIPHPLFTMFTSAGKGEEGRKGDET